MHLAFLSLCLALSAPAQASLQDLLDLTSVIRGTKVQRGEAIGRAVVSITSPEGNCTGTLVADQVVLTAAHCNPKGKPQGMLVTHRTTSKLEEQIGCYKSTVEEVAFPPNAKKNESGNWEPDLMLLRLSRPLCGITPAQIRREAVKEQEIVTLAGYGYGTKQGNLPDRIDLRVFPFTNATAANFYYDLDRKLENESKILNALPAALDLYETYLAGEPMGEGQAACHGDSGGPIYEEKEGEAFLVGVDGAFLVHPRRGTDECQSSYLVLFTPLFGHREWILRQSAEWGR